MQSSLPAQSTSPASRTIRATTAKFMTAVAKAAFENDSISFEELSVIRAAMQELSKTGLLPRAPEKRLVDLHEVARLLSVSEPSLKRWLSDGSIHLHKVRIGPGTIVRFKIEDVLKIVDGIEVSKSQQSET